jgi:hypothetical protein
MSWVLAGQNAYLRHQNRTLLSAREYPLVFAGMRLDLLPRVSPLRSSNIRSSQTNHKLLLAFDDTCGVCERNIPQWLKLLQRGSGTLTGSEVWFLSFSTTHLIEPLESYLVREGLPYRVMRVNDPMAFGLVTGVVAVPSTIVLDERDAVDMVATGVLSDPSLDLAIARLERGGAPIAAARFVRSDDLRALSRVVELAAKREKQNATLR